MTEMQPKPGASRFVSTVRAGFGVALLALVVLFVWKLATDYTRATYEARHYNAAYDEGIARRITVACPDRAAAGFHACVARQVEKTREDQRAEHNLGIQRQLADWAFWMLVVSVGALVLTAATLWFVKGTLDATRATVAEAERATAAAQGSLKVSEDAAKRQLRAYVFPEDAEIRNKPDGWTVAVRIRNAGVTPAENVLCDIDVRYVEFPMSRDLPPYEAGAIRYPFMPPGSERRIAVEGVSISDAEMAKIRRCEAGIYCRCTITYTTLGEHIEVADTEGVATGSDVDDGIIRGVSAFVYEEPRPDEDGQAQLDLSSA